jgi:hypothetical protein
MKRSWLSGLGFLGALCGFSCGGDGYGGNPPLAALRAPSFCDLGTVMVLDASGSSDPDGDIVRYRFTVSDGTQVQDGTDSRVEHICRTAGIIEAVVQVIDATGNTSRASAIVSVRRP